MTKIVTLIATWQDGCDRGSKVATFRYDGGVGAEQAMREAIRLYLERPDVAADWGAKNYPPNWGDLLQEMDNEDWRKVGLELLDTPDSQKVLVDHDETFDTAWEYEDDEAP